MFPQYEIEPHPVAIRDFVQTVEGLGFSHILVYDHVLGAEHQERQPPLDGPYTEHHAFHEPLTVLAYMSGVTDRIELTTGVLVLPQRQTALVAKQACEVALLSTGRLRLGVGLGWNHVEYSALGQSMLRRGQRLEEQVELMRQLWNEPVVQFNGQWDKVDRAGILPRPESPIPIWFGGFADAARERAARIADGFLFSRRGGRRAGTGASEPIAEVVEQARRLRDRVIALGRQPDAFGIEGRINYSDGPAAWTAEVDEFRRTGFDYVAVNCLDAGLTSASRHLDALRMFASAVSIRPDDGQPIRTANVVATPAWTSATGAPTRQRERPREP